MQLSLSPLSLKERERVCVCVCLYHINSVPFFKVSLSMLTNYSRHYTLAKQIVWITYLAVLLYLRR